ncbi:MAG: hypothetical protein KatS3mg032_1464 [Cyclobacteriaceae bacterium]|nr:MAG: hypothetical protein KatS3mg032_1464 [Cyclobacteriaceae bacterium]
MGMKYLLVILAVVLLAPAKAQVTIENLLNVPYPSLLTASHDRKHIAWVFNEQGQRNIYVATAPDFTPRKITGYNQDDGQEIAELRFLPDNHHLIFIRGGAPNRAGELPNPAARQTGVERAIWIIGTDGSDLKKLATGHSPEISPDGKRIAYISGGQVHLVHIDSAGTGKRLFHARGTQHDVRWSPDGSKLVFASVRQDHAFIGLYDFTRKSLYFPDPSVDHDGHPAWSPDGRYVAWIRVPHDQNRLPFVAKREGHPWSLRLLDMGNGQVHELWRAKTGRGSVLHQGIPVANNLLWWLDDFIVFPWEADGWQHLYAIRPAGGEARLLTPGAGEIESVAVSGDGKSLLAVSNIGDIDRRHLFRINPAAAAPTQITSGEGIEYQPVETVAGIVCLRTDATTPAWLYLVQPNGQMRMLATREFPQTFPRKDLVKPQPVTFTATDGMPIPAQLFLPRDVRPGDKRPAVIFFHGGSRRQMVLGFHYSQYYHNAYALNQYLAARGYVVLSVNYRSGIGYGLEFREALNYGADGASEYHDVVGAGLYLAQRPEVNPRKIGLWGGSYGGYLTAMGLARASDLFACGVDIHGVHDWNEVIRNFVPAYKPENHEEFAQKARESSPMHFVKSWRSPVLLIHGDDDRNVPFSETVNLAESLRKQGVYFEQLIFPDEVHGFLLHKNWLSAYQAAADFFKRMLEKNSRP